MDRPKTTTERLALLQCSVPKTDEEFFALSYNLCRTKLRRLEELERERVTPRAPGYMRQDDLAGVHRDRAGHKPRKEAVPDWKMPDTSAPDSEAEGGGSSATSRPPRKAFVTVGATAGFRKLLVELLRPEFLLWMREYGFDEMTVQCGPDEEWFRSCIEDDKDAWNTYGVQVNCFAYTTRMQDYIVPCRPVAGKRRAGIVISHAGAGSVVEISRYSVPFVVVPNPDLMNNHQLELAEHLDNERCAVNAKLSGLPEAIREAHKRAFAGGLGKQHQDPFVKDEQLAFPLPESSRITVLDWLTLSAYDEEPEGRGQKREAPEIP